MKSYRFKMYLKCVLCNPNGDPDADNEPRVTSDGYGLISDVAIKRRIRDYINLIYGDNHETKNILIKSHANIKKLTKDGLDNIKSKYWDVRMFGIINTNENNKGNDHITGAVQISCGKSLEPVEVKKLTITRVCHEDAEKSQNGIGTIGRKYVVENGIYVFWGVVNGKMCEANGVSEDDIKDLWEALENMWLNLCTASKTLEPLALIINEYNGYVRNEFNDYGIKDDDVKRLNKFIIKAPWINSQ